jgi:hypothetical protein
MQIKNNLMFDSSAAHVGDWFNISNCVALSVHVVGLEGTVTIEASNDPDAVSGVPFPAPDDNDTPVGIAITGNLTASAVSLTDEIAIFYDGAGGAMINPSCLAWNFIRVKKVGGGTVETKAWLFGQNG